MTVTVKIEKRCPVGRVMEPGHVRFCEKEIGHAKQGDPRHETTWRREPYAWEPELESR